MFFAADVSLSISSWGCGADSTGRAAGVGKGRVSGGVWGMGSGKRWRNGADGVGEDVGKGSVGQGRRGRGRGLFERISRI